MNLFQRALLIISTVTALSWTSKVTQGALYNNLNDKALSEEQWGNAIATWWGGKDTISTTPKDPFANMSNQAIIDDVNRFFEEYLQSVSFETRLQNFDRIAKTQAMKHKEITEVIASAKPTIDTIIEKSILPPWEVIERFDVWWWYLSYTIGDREYIIAYGFNGNWYNIDTRGKFKSEAEKFQLFVNKKAYNTALNENDLNNIEDPISFRWMLLNIIIEREAQSDGSSLGWEEIRPIMIAFNDLKIAIERINNSTEETETMDQSKIDTERRQRLDNLNKGEVLIEPWDTANTISAYYNFIHPQNVSYNIDNTRDQQIKSALNHKIEAYNKQLDSHIDKEEMKLKKEEIGVQFARYQALHMPWSIVLYSDENWAISIFDISHESMHKILDWVTSKQILFNYINNYFFELRRHAIENNLGNPEWLKHNFDPEEIVANFSSLKRFMYALWYSKTPWELVSIQRFQSFLDGIKDLPEWKTKESINELLFQLKRLFLSDELNPHILLFFDSIIAQTDDMTTTYKNMA